MFTSQDAEAVKEIKRASVPHPLQTAVQYVSWCPLPCAMQDLHLPLFCGRLLCNMGVNAGCSFEEGRSLHMDVSLGFQLLPTQLVQVGQGSIALLAEASSTEQRNLQAAPHPVRNCWLLQQTVHTG